jgi:hypothetical protein
LYTYEFVSGDPGRLCVQPLGYWDGGFESLWRHRCLSLVFVVCCEVSDLCDELITHSEESNRVCVCVCDIETLIPMWAVESQKNTEWP